MAHFVLEYDRGSSVVRQFERVAHHFRETNALTRLGEALTYEALNCHANRVARALTDAGVRHGDHVALCADRSIETIVVILAILKCGASYVPLDPAYPSARLEMMLEDISAALCVVQDSLTPVVGGTYARCISMGELFRLAKRQPSHNLEVEIAPNDLAYVMYTSGSTGRPKGVCVEHRNILRLVCDTNYASFGPGEVFLLFAPLSFDASTFEIWGALLTGARLAIAPAGSEALDCFGSILHKEQVTTLWLTAGLFHQIAESGISQLTGLRQLLAGGDVLSPGHVRRVLDAVPNLRFINGYGPTECTTFACCHRMLASKDVGDPVPIGRVISHTTAYVLDENLQPLPDGTPGELFLGGDGVARGYWNRPDLSRRCFLPDPFATRRDSRMYRTGDRVVRDETGLFTFLGRIDRQVKVRGYRIELAEVERALMQSGAIEQAVVIAEGGLAHHKQLIAYLVPSYQSRRDTGELRDWLRNRLPSFMLPSLYIWIDSLPLDPNGKVDRAALPARAGSQDPAFVPLETSLEEDIARIWSEILGVDRVGRYSDFASLGGHSLAAMRIVVHVADAFGIQLPLRTLLDNPTVADFAETVEEAVIVQVEQQDV